VRNSDVVHAHGSLYATTVLANTARRPAAPLFVTEHVGFVPYSSSILNAVQSLAWRLIGDRIARRATRIVAYNSRVHEWLRNRFGSKSVFIPNGVDVSRFVPATPDRQASARARLGIDSGNPVALFVGRAAQKKNLDVILRLPRRDYRLAVCGAGRQVPDDVINLGAIPHTRMPDVFAACDFLIHPAVGEGFPVTIQEAMASGLPVIVLWDEGYGGSLDAEVVLALQSLNELGPAIDRLVTSPAQRTRFAELSREFATAHWSWESTVAIYLRMFLSEMPRGVQP
jgi:glycosyltransferase involved in cell wall biosynthesis